MVDVRNVPIQLDNEKDRINTNQIKPGTSNQGVPTKKNNRSYSQRGGYVPKEKNKNRFDQDKQKRNSQNTRYERNSNNQERSGDVVQTEKHSSINKKEARSGFKAYGRNNENGYSRSKDNNHRNKNRTRNGNDPSISDSVDQSIPVGNEQMSNNSGVWGLKRDWKKHFVEEGEEIIIANTNNDVDQVNEKDEQKPKEIKQKEKVVIKKKEEEPKPIEEVPVEVPETQKVVEELENLSLDTKNVLPSKDVNARQRVFLPPMEVNEELDQQLEVTFGGRRFDDNAPNYSNVPFPSEQKQSDISQNPIFPQQPHHINENNNNQFIVPPNNMNMRFPMFQHQMYNQPIYPNEYHNEAPWDVYNNNFHSRNPNRNNNGKKPYKKNQPKRNNKFAPTNKQMVGTNMNENINYNPEHQENINNKDDSNVTKNFPINNGSTMSEPFAMFRPPEHFSTFYGNNVYGVHPHSGMIMPPPPPYYGHPQMYGYFPHFDNNFENNDQYPQQNN